MCDQTQILYSPGDVVWVKLGPLWWPAEVIAESDVPREILKELRKPLIAVVKFFDEDSYEYVKNLNNIYHYNCLRKIEFIKKGLDMCRSNHGKVPENLKKFPSDVVQAEAITDGDPDILESEAFLPEEKIDYKVLFSDNSKKVSKKKSPTKKNDSKVESLRVITHPRFVNSPLGSSIDYEVHVRIQDGEGERREIDNIYRCSICSYTSKRQNVMVYHYKMHTGSLVTLGDISLGIKAKPAIKKGPSLKRKLVDFSSISRKKPKKVGRKKKRTKEPRKPYDDLPDSLLEDWKEYDNLEQEQESAEETKPSSSDKMACFDFDESEENVTASRIFGREIPNQVTPKSDTEQAPQVPKKRGRKPKTIVTTPTAQSSVEDSINQVTPEIKMEIEENSSLQDVPSTSGQSEQGMTSAVVPQSAGDVPRKRGRPRKSQVVHLEESSSLQDVPSTSEQIEECITSAVIPQSARDVPRKRGRPRKSQVVDQQKSPAETTDSTPRRGQRRLAIPENEVSAEHHAQDSAMPSTLETGPKRRGRKRKISLPTSGEENEGAEIQSKVGESPVDVSSSLPEDKISQEVFGEKQAADRSDAEVLKESENMLKSIDSGKGQLTHAIEQLQHATSADGKTTASVIRDVKSPTKMKMSQIKSEKRDTLSPVSASEDIKIEQASDMKIKEKITVTGSALSQSIGGSVPDTSDNGEVNTQLILAEDTKGAKNEAKISGDGGLDAELDEKGNAEFKKAELDNLAEKGTKIVKRTEKLVEKESDSKIAFGDIESKVKSELKEVISKRVMEGLEIGVLGSIEPKDASKKESVEKTNNFYAGKTEEESLVASPAENSSSESLEVKVGLPKVESGKKETVLDIGSVDKKTGDFLDKNDRPIIRITDLVEESELRFTTSEGDQVVVDPHEHLLQTKGLSTPDDSKKDASLPATPSKSSPPQKQEVKEFISGDFDDDEDFQSDIKKEIDQIISQPEEFDDSEKLLKSSAVIPSTPKCSIPLSVPSVSTPKGESKQVVTPTQAVTPTQVVTPTTTTMSLLFNQTRGITAVAGSSVLSARVEPLTPDYPKKTENITLQRKSVIMPLIPLTTSRPPTPTKSTSPVPGTSGIQNNGMQIVRPQKSNEPQVGKQMLTKERGFKRVSELSLSPLGNSGATVAQLVKSSGLSAPPAVTQAATNVIKRNIPLSPFKTTRQAAPPVVKPPAPKSTATVSATQSRPVTAQKPSKPDFVIKYQNVVQKPRTPGPQKVAPISSDNFGRTMRPGSLTISQQIRPLVGSLRAPSVRSPVVTQRSQVSVSYRPVSSQRPTLSQQSRSSPAIPIQRPKPVPRTQQPQITASSQLQPVPGGRQVLPGVYQNVKTPIISEKQKEEPQRVTQGTQKETTVPVKLTSLAPSSGDTVSQSIPQIVQTQQLQQSLPQQMYQSSSLQQEQQQHVEQQQLKLLANSQVIAVTDPELISSINAMQLNTSVSGGDVMLFTLDESQGLQNSIILKSDSGQENVYFNIDDTQTLVEIPYVFSEVNTSTMKQDILAKALENTDVLTSDAGDSYQQQYSYNMGEKPATLALNNAIVPSVENSANTSSVEMGDDLPAIQIGGSVTEKSDDIISDDSICQ